MNIKSARYRRIFWRKNRQLILELVVSTLLVFLLLLMATFIHNYKDKQIITPRPHKSTVQDKVVAKVPLRPQTDEGYIKSLPHGQLVWATYGHESGYGKNDGCKSQGLYNGFGFGQNKFGYQCFSSVREVAKKVSDWFSLHLQYMTVNQSLCYYNEGRVLDDCDYAEYTLSL